MKYLTPQLIVILFFLLIRTACTNSSQMTNEEIDYSSQKAEYLALGDSYTIGEAVGQDERFPVNLIR